MSLQHASLRSGIARVVVVVSLVLLPVYLTWRVVWTSRGAFVPLFVALFVAEVASIVRFLAQVVPTLVGSRSVAPAEPRTGDIVIVVGAEPLLPVRTSIQAALRVDGAREVLVLDTVGRADLARYCGSLGVARVEHADALGALLGSDLTVVVPASQHVHPDILAVAAATLSGPHDVAVTAEVRFDQARDLVGSSGYLLAADQDAASARWFDRFGAAAPLYGPLVCRRSALEAIELRSWDPNRVLLDIGVALQRNGGRVRPSDRPLASRRLPTSEEAALRARARLSVGRLGATRRPELRGLTFMQRVNYHLANTELFASASTVVAIAIPSVVALTGFLPLTLGFAGVALVGAPWLLASGLARRLTDPRREPIGSHLRRVARTAVVDLRVLGRHEDPVPSAAVVASLQATTAMVLFGLCVSAALVPFTRFALLPLPNWAGASVLVASLVLLWLARDVYLAIEDRQHRSMARCAHTSSPSAPVALLAVRSISPLGFDADTELELEVGQRIGVTMALPEADGSAVHRHVGATVARVGSSRTAARLYVEFDRDEALFDQLLYFVSVTATRLREVGVDYHVIRDVDLDPPAEITQVPYERLDLQWLHEETAMPMASELQPVS